MATTRPLRLCLAQINTTVGDLAGNADKVREAIARAREAGATVVAFPELTLCGYPAEDLLMRPQFVRDTDAVLATVAKEARDIVAVVGTVYADGDVYNSAAVCAEGGVTARYHKRYLPNYGVFDEARYFQRGAGVLVVRVNGVRLGVTICEDIWYPGGPLEEAVLEGGAEVVLNISASPYQQGKSRARERMLATRAADAVAAVAYCNLVGGQDELLFDGGSLLFDQAGELVARAPLFAEQLLFAEIDADDVFRQRLHDPRRRVDLAFGSEHARRQITHDLKIKPRAKAFRASAPAVAEPHVDAAAEVYAALVLGTRDYVEKNGFRGVVLGLSGGIDSALTATIAADALGAARVTGVSMPSRFTESRSQDDAAALASALGIRFDTVAIEPMVTAFETSLAQTFRGRTRDETEENIQARVRGTVLMALSNKFGWLVLTTGNKSELGVGYCTLYGDMAGGFAVLKDVPKTLVYDLARHVNRVAGRERIPQSTIDRPPTAELRPEQTDQDSLPPYDILDAILKAYIEEDRSIADIVADGFEARTVQRVARLVDRSEYKRRQGPPGIKISPRAFGKDRRLPITNRYREAPASPATRPARRSGRATPAPRRTRRRTP